MDRTYNATKGMMVLMFGLLVSGCVGHQEGSVVYRQGPPADEAQPTWGRRLQPTQGRYGQVDSSRPSPSPQVPAHGAYSMPPPQQSYGPDRRFTSGQGAPKWRDDPERSDADRALRHEHQRQVNQEHQRFQWKLRVAQIHRVMAQLARKERAYRLAIRSHRRLYQSYRQHAYSPEHGEQAAYTQRAQQHLSVMHRYQGALRFVLARKARLQQRLLRYGALAQGHEVAPQTSPDALPQVNPRAYLPATAAPVRPRGYVPATPSAVQPRRYQRSTASLSPSNRVYPSATPSLVQPPDTSSAVPPINPSLQGSVQLPNGSGMTSMQPVEPSYASPSVDGDAALVGWKAHCAQERTKHNPVAAPRFTDQAHLQTRFGRVDVQRYRHGLSEQIQAIGASKNTVLLGMTGRYTEAFCSDRSISVWYTPRKRLVTLKPPIRDYLLRHRSLHPWFQGIRKASGDLEVAHLDLDRGVGGLLLHLPQTAQLQGRQRTVYLHWDVRNNAITGHLSLVSSGCHRQFRVVGFDQQSSRLLLLREEGYQDNCKLPADQPQRKALLGIKWPSGDRQIIARFQHQYRLERIVASEGMAKIALAEYTELPNQQGHVIVVDTVTGKTLQKPIPKTPYGLLFTPDQQALLVYSAKAALLVRVPLSLAAAKAEVRTRALGHAMGLSKDRKKLFVLFHAGIEVRDAETLKLLGFLSINKTVVGDKFVHVDGSAILQGTLFVKNGETLHIHTPS